MRLLTLIVLASALISCDEKRGSNRSAQDPKRKPVPESENCRESSSCPEWFKNLTIPQLSHLSLSAIRCFDEQLDKWNSVSQVDESIRQTLSGLCVSFALETMEVPQSRPRDLLLVLHGGIFDESGNVRNPDLSNLWKKIGELK